MKSAIKKMRRRLALLVVTALCTGMMPVESGTVGRAASSVPKKQTARAGYGLKNPRTNACDVTTWDCVWFGSYWQEDTNGDGSADKNDAKTPIKWRVLSVDGDDAFLIADQNLDCQKYNDTKTDVTWETSTIRSWLNGYGAEMNKDGKDCCEDNFLDNAFSESEQSAICTTYVVNKDHPSYKVDGGNSTLDKVYLLSLDEVSDPVHGFLSNYSMSDYNKLAKNTAYAETQGAGSWVPLGDAEWWLRSPGDGSDHAACVTDDGERNEDGTFASSDGIGVRPVLHLNLKESSDTLWSYAGTVVSVEVGKISSVKLKQKKRAVTVSWKKLSTMVGYYQVCYSTSKNWKNQKRKSTGARNNKLTIKKLKKKKTYYIRVRAYGVITGGTIYGAWSKTKKITIKN